MKSFDIGISPATGIIYIGTKNKDGIWQDRTDITDAAIRAVAQHMERTDIESIRVKGIGELRFRREKK